MHMHTHKWMNACMYTAYNFIEMKRQIQTLKIESKFEEFMEETYLSDFENLAYSIYIINQMI